MKNLRKFEWTAVWLATKLYLFAVGVGALIVWFCEPMGWLLRTGSIVTAVCTWLLIFKITLGYFERQTKSGCMAKARGRAPGDAESDSDRQYHSHTRKAACPSEAPGLTGGETSTKRGMAIGQYSRTFPVSKFPYSLSSSIAECELDAAAALINLEYPPRVARRAVRNAVKSGAQDFESIFRSAQAQLRT